MSGFGWVRMGLVGEGLAGPCMALCSCTHHGAEVCDKCFSNTEIRIGIFENGIPSHKCYGKSRKPASSVLNMGLPRKVGG